MSEKELAVIDELHRLAHEHPELPVLIKLDPDVLYKNTYNDISYGGLSEKPEPEILQELRYTYSSNDFFDGRLCEQPEVIDDFLERGEATGIRVTCRRDTIVFWVDRQAALPDE